MPNRVVMGSMHTGLEDRARNTGRLAAYFAERARGGVGLIVTGGYAPNRTGWLLPFGAKLTNRLEARRHRTITDAVHAEGGRILLQILHAGRYSYWPLSVSASSIKAPINPFRPRRLTSWGVRRQIRAYVRCARLAQQAGYDGVEIMGGEGYFINQFLAERTNRRTDAWGGSAENRRRLPVEIVRRTREAVGPNFGICFRLSMADLVEGGQRWDEIVALAQEIERAGATLINTDIGWHESRVPTIVTSVPRAAFADVTAELAKHVGIPVAASNRINMPETAEEILARGDAQLISMARPMLADPEWVRKAAAGVPDEINTCIACNQACLDHAFVNKHVSCLLNPRAGRETELLLAPTRRRKTVAVVGAGPAGLAAAVNLARRGHSVTLFEADDEIGGQFGIARRIPGKEEFAETVRYFRRQLELTKVQVRLGTRAGADDLIGAYDEVVVATGVTPPRARNPRHRSSQRAVLPAGRPGRCARRRPCRRDRGGRDRRRRLRVPHPRPFPHPRPGRMEARVGRHRPEGRPGGTHRAPPVAVAAGGVPAAAQARPDREGPRQDQRMGAPGVPEAQEGARDLRCQLRADRRRRPAHQLRCGAP